MFARKVRYSSALDSRTGAHSSPVLISVKPERRRRSAVISGEAYSHECSSAGWWPGSGEIKGPAFYAYTVPEPLGYSEQPISPSAAFYHPQLHEFILMYDDLRRSPSPDAELLEFFQSAYEAGANLAGWDRTSLERASLEG